jgi:hypothetical protein
MISRKDTWWLCRLLLSSHLHSPSFSQPASSSKIYVLSFSLGLHPLWSFYLVFLSNCHRRCFAPPNVEIGSWPWSTLTSFAITPQLSAIQFAECAWSSTTTPCPQTPTAFGKEMYEPPQWIHVSVLSPYNYSRAVAQLHFPHILRLSESLPIKSDFNMQCLVPQDCSICSAQGGENDIRFYPCH